MIPTIKLLGYAQTMPRTADQSTRRDHPPRRPRHGFFRLALALALMISMFTALIMGAITSRPYSNPELEAFFAQRDGWGGIVIGETTRDEALVILQAHPWVGDVWVNDNIVSWRWNGQQPEFLVQGRISDGRIDFEQSSNPRVTAMWIPTAILLADVLVELGQPSQYVVLYEKAPSPHFTYIVQYDNNQLRISGAIPQQCPASIVDYLHWPVRLDFGGFQYNSRLYDVAISNTHPNWIFSPPCTPPAN